METTENGLALVTDDQTQQIGKNSQLQTIEVNVDLVKVPNRSLGFSIAGGKGSTPAYEDVDESIFVTKVAPGGLAEQDGRLRLGDKLLSVNGIDMTYATHTDAVTTLKNITDECRLVVSREILVVMPDEFGEVSFLDDDGTNLVRETTIPILDDEGDMPSREERELSGEKLTDDSNGQASADNAESFARMIVSEILDQSTIAGPQLATSPENANNASPVAMDTAEERKKGSGTEPSDATSPKTNYVNYDVAQVVGMRIRIASSSSPGATPQPDQKSETPGTTEDSRSFRTEDSLSISYQDDDEEDYPRERVILDRSIGRLGLSIVGGSDHASRVFGMGKPGIYISKISSDGAAAATGRLKLGDKIIKVNGQDLRYATHKQAVHWLVSQKGNINLIVQHIPPPSGMQEVIIVKEEGEKLGICIKGGGKGSKGNPLDKEDDGIFISRITANCAAEKDGRLRVGQRLMEVNGATMLGASHSDAVNSLRSVPDKIKILVCDGYDPHEVLRRKKRAEAERASLDAAVKNLSLLSQSSENLWNYTGSLKVRGVSKNRPSYSSQTLPTKSSHSKNFIVDDNRPVTAEELDHVLEGIKGMEGIELPPPPPPAPNSTPVPPPPPSSTAQTISSITHSLQTGDFDLSGDKTDEMEFELNAGGEVMVNGERGEGEGEEDSGLEDEASIEDTGVFLEQLDSKMSSMQNEVSRTEEEVEEAARKAEEEAERKKKQEEEMQRKRKEKEEMIKVASSEVIEVDIKQIDFPLEQPIGEEAMQSIVDIFDDLPVEDFKVPSNEASPAPESGTITPMTELCNRITADDSTDTADMNELLRQLRNLGEEESSSPMPKRPDHKQPVKPVKPVQSTGPVLRVPKANRNTENRKSAPPIAMERPVIVTEDEQDGDEHNPEALSFKEKLALHKKMADSPQQERKLMNNRPRSTDFSTNPATLNYGSSVNPHMGFENSLTIQVPISNTNSNNNNTTSSCTATNVTRGLATLH